jgi:hypothetical protein
MALPYFNFVVAVALTAVTLTVVFTVAICRWRTAHDKKVSCGTLAAGAFSAAACTFGFVMYLFAGGGMFLHAFWQDLRKWGVHSSFLKMFALTAMPCVLAALAVVGYYQTKGRRSRSNEHHVP